MAKSKLPSDKSKASQFVTELREWVGNDPVKAAAFGVICGLGGYLLNIWPL